MATETKWLDRLWAVEVKRRLDEFRSGKLKTIPGEKVPVEVPRRFGH